MKEKRRKNVLKGKCQNGCGPKAKGHTYCQKCLDRMAESNKVRK